MFKSKRSEFNAEARKLLKKNGFTKRYREAVVAELKSLGIDQATNRLNKIINDPGYQKCGKYKRQKLQAN